jgi:hypothetical protein
MRSPGSFEEASACASAHSPHKVITIHTSMNGNPVLID